MLKQAVECEAILYFIFILKLVVIVLMHSYYTDTIFFVVCFSLVPRQRGFAVAAGKKIIIIVVYVFYLLFKINQNTKTKLKIKHPKSNLVTVYTKAVSSFSNTVS